MCVCWCDGIRAKIEGAASFLTLLAHHCCGDVTYVCSDKGLGRKWHFWRWLAWWKKLLFPAEWDQLVSVSTDLPVELRLPG